MNVPSAGDGAPLHEPLLPLWGPDESVSVTSASKPTPARISKVRVCTCREVDADGDLHVARGNCRGESWALLLDGNFARRIVYRSQGRADLALQALAEWGNEAVERAFMRARI